MADIDALLPHPLLRLRGSDSWTNLFKSRLPRPTAFKNFALRKSCIGQNINRLVAVLPGKLLREARADVCNSKDNCLKNGLPQVDGLDEFVNVANLMRIKGSLMVERCFTERCSRCKSKLTKFIDEGREEIWERVPIYFGFPGWNVLQARLKDII